MEQRIAQDTCDFRELRENGYVYVDKTALLHRLVSGQLNGKLFFISRPRRFGKSLMLSTLKSIFRGERDLFKSLAIDTLGYDWVEYPILSFNFATMATETLEAFQTAFVERVGQALRDAGVEYNAAGTPGGNFANAIRTLAKTWGKPVVVLIDEYDSPVSRALDDVAKATAIRDRLAAFYGEIKNNAADLRFMMMTGVTKFTQLSVFSALNNLTDLTLDGNFATLLGYTDDSPWVKTTVYNPVAVARTLSRRLPVFETTWSETGHASALMRYLAREDLASRDYTRLPATSKDVFDSYDLGKLRPETVLYQAGYLTIKDFNPFLGYILGVPDEDVRQDLNGLLLSKALGADAGDTRDGLRTALLTGDFPGFFDRLKAFYAHLPYGAKEKPVHEASYQRALYGLLSAGGLCVTAEDRQAQGRADLVAEAMNQVYVFELKVGGTAQEAFAQIKVKGYAAPYLDPDKTVHLIGLAFDPVTNTLADAVVETLTPAQ